MKYILFEWFQDEFEPVIEAGPSWCLPVTKWWSPSAGWVDYTSTIARVTMDELRQSGHGGYTVRVIDEKEVFVLTL